MVIKRLLFSIIAILFITHVLQAQTITPYFSIRSQGLNTPRHISGLVHQSFTERKHPRSAAG